MCQWRRFSRDLLAWNASYILLQSNRWWCNRLAEFKSSFKILPEEWNDKRSSSLLWARWAERGNWFTTSPGRLFPLARFPLRLTEAHPIAQIRRRCDEQRREDQREVGAQGALHRHQRRLYRRDGERVVRRSRLRLRLDRPGTFGHERRPGPQSRARRPGRRDRRLYPRAVERPGSRQTDSRATPGPASSFPASPASPTPNRR